jgi:HAD superfamily hydrolase (TIGR01457 family)
VQSLREMRGAVIDMDGVLWAGRQPLPGLLPFFDALLQCQVRFILATNNSSLTPEQYVAKLAAMGVAVSIDKILTSAQATASYLRPRVGQSGARVFPIGEDGVLQALTATGFQICGLYETPTDYVVVGMDRGLSWDKLATATLNIRAGAVFVGTNPDVTLPTERGITHGNGAILAALQAATGVRPIVIGKPEPIMYQQALERLGTDPACTVAIGDRLDTDILGAARAGLPSVLVLTGISRREDLATAPAKPTWVRADIRELTSELLAPATPGASRGLAVQPEV